ncbi:MAG: ABC transporter permease [Muribaculaceae bacterium]|nr:ABC transporter permease [Muribaculaceae bacterium]
MKSYFTFLRRNKAYAAIDIFGLAISMMFVVLIGGYTWQEMHTDRQHSKADRMYWLGLNINGEKSKGSCWYLQFLLRDRLPEIENSTALFRLTLNLNLSDRKILTNCYMVDSTFYDIFDFKLIQGDPKSVFNHPNNIVVTAEYARKTWGDGDPIGKSIILVEDEQPLVVAGIMEPMKQTAFMTEDRQPVDMLVNFSMLKHINSSLVSTEMYNAGDANVIMLAKDGHDLINHKKEIEEAVKNDFWPLKLPGMDGHIEVYPFEESYFSEIIPRHANSGDRKLVSLLFGVGLVILLFAIMNYINLTVALVGKRAKEMATRRLLGEDRHHIMWRLILESTVLCAFSMLVGIALAFIMKPYASAVLNTPIDITGCVNAMTVSILILVLMVMSVVSGIIPALMLSAMKPIEAVKGELRRKSNMIFGKTFIVIQNVTTIVMVACALTMYLQVRHLIEAPLGYDPQGIVKIPIQFTENLANDAMLFKDELMKLSCVEKVSFSMGEPHQRGNNNTVTQDGRTISFREFVADSVFLDILRFNIKKELNHASGIKHYLNMQAISELGLDDDATHYVLSGDRIPIAGIVSDFKIGNILSNQSPVRIIEAKPFEDFWPWNLLIKTTGDRQQAIERIKETFEKVYPKDLADSALEMPFLTQQIEKDFDYQKNLSTILTVFAIVAIILSILGLTAMSTYYVRQRSQDIAIHKVMGGTSTEVLTKLVRTFMNYVLIAAVISIPIIYYVMNDWLSQFSYRINIHWWIYASCALLAIIICFISVVSQCSKAANVNPINSLK